MEKLAVFVFTFLKKENSVSKIRGKKKKKNTFSNSNTMGAFSKIKNVVF